MIIFSLKRGLEASNPNYLGEFQCKQKSLKSVVGEKVWRGKLGLVVFSSKDVFLSSRLPGLMALCAQGYEED